MNKFVSGAIGFEVALPQNVARVSLPDLATLKYKRIKHIDCCAITKTANNNDVLASNYFPSVLLTIKEMNTQTELIRSLPCSLLNPKNRLFINKIGDLPHSFIDIAGIDNATRLNKYLYFVVWFDEPEIWGRVPEQSNRTEIHPLELKLTGNKTYFLENRDLVDKKFQNILLSYPYFTPNGNPGVTMENVAGKFITLKKGNLEFFQRIPLYLFFQNLNPYPLRIQNVQIDLQNSFIESLTVTADDLKTVFFNVVIDDNKN